MSSPNLRATVALSLQPLVDAQNVVLDLPEDFDLDEAIGAQLDVVGLWVGVSRYLEIPIPDLFFSWNTAGLGWGQGRWRGPFEPVDGLTVLDDDTYRLVIKGRIASDNWDGTVVGAAAGLATVFNSITFPFTTVYIRDNQDMTFTIGSTGAPLPPLYKALLQDGVIGFKPGGVTVLFSLT